MSENHELPRLNRLTKILLMLQSKRIISSVEIAEKFNISRRTAYRDIRALEQSGVPIYTVDGKGYSLMEGYSLPPIMFSEEEANALITAAKLVGQNKDSSLIRYHENAIEKVKSVLRQKNKDKANLLSERVVHIQNLGHEITSDSLSKIQLAITNEYVMTMDYLSISKEEKTKREVEPMALYHSHQNWVMIAWCRLRKAYREFRIDHIQHLVMENDLFSSRDFNLMNYFNDTYS